MYLPSAPTDKEKFLYENSGRKLLYTVSAASTIILVAGMILFVKSNPYFIPYTIFSVATITYLFFTYLIGLMSKDFKINKHRFLVSKHFDKSASQEIDIWLPVCGEPITVLANTWNYVKRLQETHEGRCDVYVLDDSRSEEVQKLAKMFKFFYIARADNHLKKAGNLRHAFKLTSSPYFIVFDADFVPRKDFIVNTMPYFYEDPKVGIVQTPQFFEVDEKQTFVQKWSGSVQELFYRLIQVNRDHFDGAICVGSNAVYSRKHLEKFGGTADIGYSEDVRTGFRLTAAGEKVRYIPLNLAKGLCADNWKTFFTQYYRWSMGSLSLMLAKEFWVAKITKYQRICYLTGMLYYLTTGLSVIFAPLPSIYLLIFRPDMIHWYNLIFSLPSLIVSVFFLRIWQKLPYSINVLRIRHVSSFAHLYALRDLLRDSLEEWKPTGAQLSSSRFDSFKTFYLIHTISVPLIIMTLVLVRVAEGHDPINFILLTLFTAFNVYITLPILKELDQ